MLWMKFNTVTENKSRKKMNYIILITRNFVVSAIFLLDSSYCPFSFFFCCDFYEFVMCLVILIEEFVAYSKNSKEIWNPVLVLSNELKFWLLFVFSFVKHLFLLLSPRTFDVIRLIISFALLFSLCVVICCYGCRIFSFHFAHYHKVFQFCGR